MIDRSWLPMTLGLPPIRSFLLNKNPFYSYYSPIQNCGIWHWKDFPSKNTTALKPRKYIYPYCKRDSKLKYDKDGKPMPTLNALRCHAQPYQ